MVTLNFYTAGLNLKVPPHGACYRLRPMLIVTIISSVIHLSNPPPDPLKTSHSPRYPTPPHRGLSSPAGHICRQPIARNASHTECIFPRARLASTPQRAQYRVFGPSHPSWTPPCPLTRI